MLKSWWFWVLLLYTTAFTLAMIRHSITEISWVCTAAFLSYYLMSQAEEIHNLRMDNINLAIHLLKTTQMLAEKTLEDKKDGK